MSESQKDSFGNLNDAEIWSLFLKGNEHAFHFIYQTNFDRLYNYGCQFTSDHMLVEDAIQEVFIDLHKRARFLSATDKILPYLFTAFRRKIIRMIERSRKHQTSEVDESFAFELSMEDEMIEKNLNESTMLRLKSSLEDLSPRYREIIYHFYYENLSYNEIQEILAFENIKSVRNLLYKALKALRKHVVVIMIGILVFFRPLCSDRYSIEG